MSLSLFGNMRGVSALSIILLGMVVLSVVLLNSISIFLQEKEDNQLPAGEEIAVSYCKQGHEKIPPSCTITTVYKCGTKYLLGSSCLGVGNIILDQQGEFISWCGYTSLDEAPEDCNQYLVDEEGNECVKTNNLCQRQ